MSHIPSSGNTIRKWIIDDFKERRQKVQAEFSQGKGLVHFSFDMWTSPSSMWMIAIFAHHVTKSGEVRDCLIGLKRVGSSHSGQNMADTIIPVIKEYGLQDRLGYFMLDNITSNDSAVRAIIRELQPGQDPGKHRLRCFGHILNLAVKAFLSGKRSQDLDESEEESEDDTEAPESELEPGLKIKVGLEALQRLRRIIKYIRDSSQRREAFVKLSNDEMAEEAKGNVRACLLFCL